MRSITTRPVNLCLAGLLTLAGGGSALADDSEIFIGSATGSTVPPNILLVLDTSGSMGSTVYSRPPYDPKTDYGAGHASACDSSNYYYTASDAALPTKCSSATALTASSMTCAAAVSALQSGGTGLYGPDTFIQLRKKSGKYAWNKSITTAGDLVECNGDDGVDGNLSTGATHPASGNTGTTQASGWTTSTTDNYWVNGGTGAKYLFYSANYLNYLQYTPQTNEGTRLSVVQQAADTLISNLPQNVNVGLMRYDTNAHGGMVTYPVTAIGATGSATRKALTDTVYSYDAGGNTPLSETLFEAFRYYSGGTEEFGDTAKPKPSISTSLVGGKGTTYKSPIQYSCQKNYIVYLTDGLPTADDEANSDITALGTTAGSCDASGPTDSNGRCLGAMAQYLNKADLITSLAGTQTVQNYFIGFGGDPELNAGFSYLQSAANKGGGQAYLADDLDALQTTLSTIVGNILSTASTFTAPTVSVNAFNRTQTLDDLYVTLFQPNTSFHWDGNLKKYRIGINAAGNTVIMDRASDTASPAVDSATGLFLKSSHDFWQTDDLDGSVVVNGGAANVIPQWNFTLPKHRNLYTYIGTNPGLNKTAAMVSVDTTNTALTNTVIGLSATSTNHDNVIQYARGEDLKDENNNKATDDTRHRMGDPMHSQPAVVVYGGTPASQDINDSVVFVATNDGYLHALDVVTGTELWSYIPQELLSDLAKLYSNSTSSAKHYSLDGDVTILKYDVNGDGVVNSADGDRVILVIGQGRGGTNYYALDVTSKTTPKFLWTLGASTLTNIDTTNKPSNTQLWSTPVFARVNVKGATQNSQKFVMIVGGGYDTTEDTPTYAVPDAVTGVAETGNRIYMVDALYGTLLWSAGAKTSTADLKLKSMDHAIPSTVSVIDTNNDGLADRMYVGDMAGQVWRFDITNGNSSSTLVAGGVIASLGSHDEATHTLANNRRFYNMPDISLIRRVGYQPYYNIAIGSGYRGHPLNTAIQDRFYSLKDTSPFTALTQTQYDTATVTKESDLTDITSTVTPTIPTGSKGWMLQLNQPGNSWVGEKVLSPSTTLQGKIIFSTYIPTGASSGDPCTPTAGANRLYSVSAFDGSPVDNLQNKDNKATDDRYTVNPGSGISGGTALLFTSSTTQNDCKGAACGGGDGGGGSGCTGAACGSGPTGNLACVNGVNVLGVCKGFNSRIRTFWQQSGVD